MTQAGAGSGVISTWHLDGHAATLRYGQSPERAQWERSLQSEGRGLPLTHRSAWTPLQHGGLDSWFIALSGPDGRPCGAVTVQLTASRALPGHVIARCERFGPGLSPGAQRLALHAIASLARGRRRVVRVHVETFAIDAGERAVLEANVAAAGFTRVHPPRSYEHTLLVPLNGTEESIFAALHSTARRHVRAVGKNPVEVRLVEDPAFFPRLDELSRETYARTGGDYDPPDWGRIVALGAQEPSASRLVGLFRTDTTGPSSLLAFAWGCGHGDHVHYSRAASTRDTDLRMPLMYPVVWDLIRWARQHGARYFDFGGITLGGHQSADPLGGISDFKRYFSERTEQVGAEWILEPRALQANAARLVSSASSFVSRVLARSRRSASATATRPAPRSPDAPAVIEARETVGIVPPGRG